MITKGMRKVFIVEDNKDLCNMYERLFKLHGHEVTVASDGLDALDKLRQVKTKPAVILLDVILPKMSGLDVLRALKNDEELKNIPVVILTNSFNETNENLFLAQGASLYLVKIENDIIDVIEKVNKLLSLV